MAEFRCWVHKPIVRTEKQKKRLSAVYRRFNIMHVPTMCTTAAGVSVNENTGPILLLAGITGKRNVLMFRGGLEKPSSRQATLADRALIALAL